ncbi:hypothetical protein CPB83DRAFT_582823 [Crepidotus variabilis]|uniref:Uncharacterized protein n=1 Tax=Crepidotus variabilis TaxID=179855 RepID=A0A9P6EPK3_9AGAR|nr:hypothetical protein CPB83DRAFT_582823 [Crepidotus variabilis]
MSFFFFSLSHSTFYFDTAFTEFSPFVFFSWPAHYASFVHSTFLGSPLPTPTPRSPRVPVLGSRLSLSFFCEHFLPYPSLHRIAIAIAFPCLLSPTHLTQSIHPRVDNLMGLGPWTLDFRTYHHDSLNFRTCHPSHPIPSQPHLSICTTSNPIIQSYPPRVVFFIPHPTSHIHSIPLNVFTLRMLPLVFFCITFQNSHPRFSLGFFFRFRTLAFFIGVFFVLLVSVSVFVFVFVFVMLLPFPSNCSPLPSPSASSPRTGPPLAGLPAEPRVG